MYKEAGKKYVLILIYVSHNMQEKLCSQPGNLLSVRPVKPLLKLIVFSEILWKPVLP